MGNPFPPLFLSPQLYWTMCPTRIAVWYHFYLIASCYVYNDIALNSVLFHCYIFLFFTLFKRLTSLWLGWYSFVINISISLSCFLKKINWTFYLDYINLHFNLGWTDIFTILSQEFAMLFIYSEIIFDLVLKRAFWWIFKYPSVN